MLAAESNDFFLLISYIIRRYQREVQDSLGDQTTESAPPNMVVYKKSVRNTLWIHSTLVTCYLPHLVVSAIMLRSQTSLSILIAQRLTVNLINRNSFLNPILGCWKIKEIRHAVKRTFQKISVFFLVEQAQINEVEYL